MPSDEIIETMARAISPVVFDIPVGAYDRPEQELYLAARRRSAQDRIRAALSAAEAAGWVMMPVTPTREMVDAGLHASDFASTKTSRSNFTRVYRAMLAAAGEPE